MSDFVKSITDPDIVRAIAADKAEIERLTKERDCAIANLSKAEYDRDACQKEVEQLRDELDKEIKLNNEYVEINMRLRTALEMAREALVTGGFHEMVITKIEEVLK